MFSWNNGGNDSHKEFKMLPIVEHGVKVTKSSPYPPFTFLKIQERRTQAKPYNLLLPYKLTYWWSSDKSKHSAGNYAGSTFSPLTFNNNGDARYGQYKSLENQAIAKAVGKFNREMAVRAQLAVTLAESRKTFDMVARRYEQLAMLARAVLRLDVVSAARALGYEPYRAKSLHREWVRLGKTKGPYTLRNQDIWNKDTFALGNRRRRRIKAASDLWLEFSFGWMPLIGEVHTALQVLSETEYYPNKIRTRATSSMSYVNDMLGQDDYYWYINYSGSHSVSVKVSLGGVLEVVNCNYRTFSRLGLVNLGLAAYETVKFSFVLNYFVNLEEYINQFTQYDNINVSQQWYTIVWTDTVVHKTVRRYKQQGGPPPYLMTYSAKAVSCKRIIGSLPTVSLGLRPAYYNGLMRAINNVALFGQLLKQIKR